MTASSGAGRPHRIVLDVSTSARWAGPPVGIVRVERAFSAWARANLADAAFVFFDPDLQRYRALNPRWRDPLLAGDAAIDPLGLTAASRPRQRRTDRIPPALRAASLWVLQSRGTALGALERARIGARSAAVARLLDRIQRPLMSPKYRARMVREDGERRASLPLEVACGDIFAFHPDDMLVCAGSGWRHTNVAAIAREKQQVGFGLAALFNDLIPLLFPQFYAAHDVAEFRAYFEAMVEIADLTLYAARAGEDDARAYCAARGIDLRRTAVSGLGADSVACGPADARTALPDGLQQDRFALFVSTIEPRKGHRMIYDVWLRLLAEGVPQAAGFKLVFVGRPGWMVDEFLNTLRRDQRVSESMLVLHTVDDPTLAALYRGAAFCVYPSIYEGYGLPVVEAFQFGKAVLSSDGGSLAEVVGDLSPRLDPGDPQVWYEMMRNWIENPAARAPYEAKIRAFRHPTWNEAAANFFAAIRAHAAPNAARLDRERA